MALHQLLSMIPHEVADARRPVVARWTETPEAGEWDPEPDYGAFVDDEGLVVTSSRPSRAFLESDDPRHLELAPGLERSLGDARVFFLDWARQPLSWEEIFDLWEAWDSQGMIADCGSVAVAWSLATRWAAPGWVAFRDNFDGAPLALVARGLPQTVPVQTPVMPGFPPPSEEPHGTSFLARALKLKGGAAATIPEGDLPMLPFTLEALKDPHHPWPIEVS